jgi:hypothetical protein
MTRLHVVQRQVEQSGASGHPLTVTLTDLVTVGDRRMKFKHGHVAGIGAPES